MKIKIKKFKRLENVEFAVPATIAGGNGSGKTTMLEAISFCLTGKDLTGKVFDELYDNRVPLQEAVADVEFTDSYHNTFRRVVKPQFAINRQGEEKLKIARSTQCYKNGIESNDYAPLFDDFSKLGTNWLFEQNETDMRKFFISLLKDRMPDFDLNEKQAELKQNKKLQNSEKSAIEALNNANIQDVEVPEITASDDEYQNALLSRQSTSKSAENANAENQKRLSAHNAKLSAISTEMSQNEKYLGLAMIELKKAKEALKEAKNECFAPQELKPTENIVAEIERLNTELAEKPFFNDLQEVYDGGFCKEATSNAEKIKELAKKEFVYVESENDGKCPLSNIECPTAKEHAKEAQRVKFEAERAKEMEALRAENRVALNNFMSKCNSDFLASKNLLELAEKSLAQIDKQNADIQKKNEEISNRFETEKQKKIAELTEKVNELTQAISEFEANSEKLKAEYEVVNSTKIEFVEVADVVISDELKAKHELFEAQKKAKIEAEAINTHNQKLREQNETEKQRIRQSLMAIAEKIADLEAEISDYFANLADIVTEVFTGDYKIEVELQKYVITKDEYADCFIITADGKKFPYECNGAMQNNVKLQVLNGLQKLAGYKGLTVFDNAEANTTTPLNTLELDAVVAMATNEKSLTIK